MPTKEGKRTRVVHHRPKVNIRPPKRDLSPSSEGGQPSKKSTQKANESKENDAVKIDENFEAWLVDQGLTIEELLSKSVKLGRPVMRQHQAKLTELANLIKEFRTAGKFLLDEKTKIDEELKIVKERAAQLEVDKDYTKQQADSQIQELQSQIVLLDQKIKEIQSYSESLQCYNTSLQQHFRRIQEDLGKSEGERLKTAEELAEAKGTNQSLLRGLEEREAEKRSVIDVLESKIRTLETAKDQDAQAIAHLKSELQRKMSELDLSREDIQKWKESAEMYRAKTGKSAEEIEKMECTKAALEGQYADQNEELSRLRKQLAVCKEQKLLIDDQIQLNEAKNAELQIKTEKQNGQIQDMEERLRKLEDDRRRLHNTIQELKGNIRVFCRVRPLKDGEKGQEPGTQNEIVQIPKTGEGEDTMMTLLCPPGPQQPHQEMRFRFDHVFRPDGDQDAIFTEISQLVQSALDGYKVCIFAYGQTGSGKTYTMVGSENDRGVIPRSMDQIFNSCEMLEECGWKFAMHATMVEIYNEEYQDLLGENGNKKRTVVHDADGNTTISDVVSVNVREPGKVDQLLEKALQKRSVGATLLNDQSSRSHFVFSLKIEGRHFDADQRVRGILNLIDLAGSERVKESGATGSRLKEAQNINRSLSALGDVIVALSNKADHVPYRNSKLTWLLQPCLGKDSKTLMFVNVSPTAEHCHESLCSLRFAAKVNACEIGVARRNIAQSSNKNTSVKD